MAKVAVVSGGDTEHTDEISGSGEGDVLPMEREEEYPKDRDMQEEEWNAGSKTDFSELYVQFG